jgi:hypothetical protein
MHVEAGMKHRREPSPIRVVRALCCAGALAACATEPATTGGNVITAYAGRQFDIRLQNVGPGEYGAPPAIMPAVTPRVQFLSVEDVGPYVPAGVTQLFHFRALSAGRATIRFERGGVVPRVLEDTVDVF